MIISCLLISLLLASTAHAATQTVYVWIRWSGEAEQIEVQQQSTDGIYKTVARVSGTETNAYRHVISDDPGEKTYCYRLSVPESGHISGERCVESPAIIDEPQDAPNAPKELRAQ